ncbi:MAG: hypothetical protein AAB019_12115 [Planctomycetota bacterium]
MKQLIVLFMLALLIIVIGFAWGIYQYRSQHGFNTGEIIEGIKTSFGLTESPEPEPVISVSLEHQPDPKDPSKSTSEGKLPEPASVTPIDVTPKYDLEAGIAGKIIKEAEVFYQQLDWPKALKKLEPVLGSKVEPGMMSQGKELKNKCQTFWELLSDITPEEMSPLNNWVKIRLNHGVQMEGQLIKETGQGLRVRLNNFETEIPATQISSYQKLTPAERRIQLKKEREKKLAVFGPEPTAYQYYETGVFCYKNQLMDEVVPLLEKAWEKDKNILTTVKDEQARSLYESYLFFKENNSKDKMVESLRKLEEKFPQSKYVALVKKRGNASVDKPNPVLEPAPVVISATLTDNEAQTIIKQADEYYEEGLVHLQKTFERGPDFDEENNLALSSFRDAIKLYEQALQNKPKDAWLQNRYNETIQCVMTARKQKRLSSN